MQARGKGRHEYIGKLSCGCNKQMLYQVGEGVRGGGGSILVIAKRHDRNHTKGRRRRDH